MFPPNRIEFDLIHKKEISIEKRPSLIRALRNERHVKRCYYYI